MHLIYYCNSAKPADALDMQFQHGMHHVHCALRLFSLFTSYSIKRPDIFYKLLFIKMRNG